MPVAPKPRISSRLLAKKVDVRPENAQRVGLRIALMQFEWQCITRAVDASDGNVTRAAELLGVKRQSLQRRIKQLRERYARASRRR